MRNYYSDSEPKQNNYYYSFEAEKIRPNEIKINVKYRYNRYFKFSYKSCKTKQLLYHGYTISYIFVTQTNSYLKI